MRNRRLPQLFAASLLCLGFGGCFPDQADGPPWLDYLDPDPTFGIGGTVEGADGALTLQNSNGTILNVAADGSFAFETRMVSSAQYDVKVVVPPREQSCTVA